MVKVSKATLATVKRFPELYRRQAMQVINKEVSEAIRTTADVFVMGAMLALIEEFGFGTKEKSTRLPRFVKALQAIVDTGADFYEDAVAEGLCSRLHRYGVEYGGSND